MDPFYDYGVDYKWKLELLWKVELFYNANGLLAKITMELMELQSFR
jgi:hypothetical protein